jgi:RHS repeat-associated protein
MLDRPNTVSTDTGGNVKERFVYHPYGAQTVLNSSWSSISDTYTWIYGFQGGRYDSYAGLYNFQRREYDPTLGRWMQQDPAGYVDGKNLYQALLDAPTDFNDMTGLQAMPGNTYSNVPAEVPTGGVPTPTSPAKPEPPIIVNPPSAGENPTYPPKGFPGPWGPDSNAPRVPPGDPSLQPIDIYVVAATPIVVQVGRFKSGDVMAANIAKTKAANVIVPAGGVKLSIANVKKQSGDFDVDWVPFSPKPGDTSRPADTTNAQGKTQYRVKGIAEGQGTFEVTVADPRFKNAVALVRVTVICTRPSTNPTSQPTTRP